MYWVQTAETSHTHTHTHTHCATSPPPPQGVAAGSILTVERFNAILKGMEETMYVIACSLGRTVLPRAGVRVYGQTWTDGRRTDVDGQTDARAHTPTLAIRSKARADARTCGNDANNDVPHRLLGLPT